MSIPYVLLDDPQYGEAVQVAPFIRRVIAKNPSKFTYHGTGTYIVGSGDVAVIDPGPISDSHREALIARFRADGYELPLDGDGWGKHPRLEVPSTPDCVRG